MFSLSRKEIANTLLHVIFVATFLAIFFFTYTANIEEELVKKQVNLILKNLLSSSKFFDDDIRTQIRTRLNDIETPDLSEEDHKVTKNNEKVLEYAIKVISISTISGLIISYFLFQSDTNPNKGTYIDLLKENAILLIFVSLTEFLFLHLIATNYVYGDANLVKKQILVSLKKYTQ